MPSPRPSTVGIQSEVLGGISDKAVSSCIPFDVEKSRNKIFRVYKLTFRSEKRKSEEKRLQDEDLIRRLVKALPDELWLHIFGFLSAPSLCSVAQTCKRWRRLALDRSLWKTLFVNRWPDTILYDKNDFENNVRIKNNGVKQHSHHKFQQLNIPDNCNTHSKSSYNSNSHRINWRKRFIVRHNTSKRWKQGNFIEHTMHGHAHAVTALQFDDNKLVSGSYDTTLKIWDLKTYMCSTTLPCFGVVRCLQFDSERIVCGSDDARIKIWANPWQNGKWNEERDKDRFIILRGHSGPVRCLRFDSTHIVSGSADNDIHIWDMQTAQKIQTYNDHTRAVWGLQFDSPSHTLVTCSDDKSVKLFDVRDKKCEQTIQLEWFPRCLQYDGDSRVLFFGGGTSGGESELHFWDNRSNLDVKFPTPEHKGWINCLQFDGDKVITGSTDKTAVLWDKEYGEWKAVQTMSSHIAPVLCLQYRNDLLATASFDTTIKIYHPRV